MLAKWALLANAIHIARAAPKAATTTAPTSLITGVATLTQAPATASPTAPLTATLPSQVPVPPVQAWCPSEIFCAGAVRPSDLPFSPSLLTLVSFFERA